MGVGLVIEAQRGSEAGAGSHSTLRAEPVMEPRLVFGPAGSRKSPPANP